MKGIRTDYKAERKYAVRQRVEGVRDDSHNIKGKAVHLQTWAKANVLMDYELVIGDYRTGRTKKMTFFDAAKYNKNKRIAFCRELDKDPDYPGKLFQWKHEHEHFTHFKRFTKAHLGQYVDEERHGKWWTDQGFELK